MMSPITFSAFADELVKIAGFQQNVGNAIVHTAKGAGKLLHQGWTSGGTFGKVTTLAGTGLMLPGAVSKEDPTGQGRTRTERMAGLAGGTLGGLAGGASPSFLKSMVGGLAGGVGGEMIAGRAARTLSPRKKTPVAQQPEQAPAQPAAAPAPVP